MIHPKEKKLAEIFLHHSLRVKPKEKVLIICSETAGLNLVKAVFIETLKIGAYPLVDLEEIDYELNRSFTGGLRYQFFRLANQWQLNYLPEEIIEAKINWADAFVRISSTLNSADLAQIEPKKLTDRQKLVMPYFEKIIDKNRWVLTWVPTPSFAQKAGLSFDWLEDFYYRSCLVDYKDMEKRLKSLEKVMDKGEIVRIIGRNTNLTFSIKGRLAQACFGERNIPDGEVFIAPLHQTLNGKIYFDLPTTALGNDVSGIYFEFRKGKVINAKAEIGQKALEAMLATDEGAQYIGEFSFGANYAIDRPLKDPLFDEKIGGTIHLALGRAYREKRGGGTNQSAIHWDLVKDMRLTGSQVTIDGKTILKDGRLQP